MTTHNRRFTAYLSEATARFLSELQLPNRSDYIEELLLKDWAAKDCGHATARQNCPACYARNELKMLKPRKDVSDKSGIQLLRQQLCSEWLTEANFAKAQQLLTSHGFYPRRLDESEQQAIFLQASFTYWGVYLAALTLTLDGKPVFGTKDIRTRLQGLLGTLWNTPGAKAGSVLPSDASEASKYAAGYDCLRIVEQGKRPTYCWMGFKI